MSDGLNGARLGLFIVAPHPQDFDDVLFFKDLIDQAMLQVNSPGVIALHIAY